MFAIVLGLSLDVNGLFYDSGMQFLHKTLPTAAENLALDEELLRSADEGKRYEEVLRVWEAQSIFVVLGRGSQVDEEVDRNATAAANIPILRRVSGGATVVAAPGCMFYSVLLSLKLRPHLRMIDQAHQLVMQKCLEAAQRAIRRGERPELEAQLGLDGTCDLVFAGRKTSGNSLRVGRDWLLYHGTFLLDMDLRLVSRLLKHPPREPEYRMHRPHVEFLTNLAISAADLQESLRIVWQVSTSPPVLDQSRIQQLATEKYAQDSWNLSR